MAAIADIVLADGLATPVNHTFNPTKKDGSIITYHDKILGVAAGYPSLTLGNRLPSGKNGNYKTTGRIRLPVLETAATAASGFTPGPTVAYSLTANIDVVVPERATLAERKDLHAYLKNLCAHAVWGSIVKDMDLPY